MVNKLKSSPKYWLVLSIGIFVLVGSSWYLLSRPDQGSGTIPTKAPPAAVDSSPNKQQSSSESSNSNVSSDNPSTDKDQSSGTSSSASLRQPYGSFVSNHRPGGSNPTSEASVCNTSPGATCFIKFTKADITKTLPVKTADANGSAYWDWDIKDAGFTQGSWQVTAVASLNGQEKTANDPLPLEVSP